MIFIISAVLGVLFSSMRLFNMMKAISQCYWKKIFPIISIILCLCFTSCRLDDFSDEHKLFVDVFNKVQTEYTNIKLIRKDYCGYGEYDIKYTSIEGIDNYYEQIISVLYEFDRIIRDTPSFSTLLNGCYIRVESVTDEWAAIFYRYDIGTEIHTNFNEDNVSTIKSYFPDTKTIICKMIDGKAASFSY